MVKVQVKVFWGDSA